MALSAGAVVAQFDGDFKGLNKGLQDAQSKVDGFVNGISGGAKAIGGAFITIGKYAAIAGAAVGGVALVMGNKAANAASDLAEAQNAVNVVFGDSANILLDFAKTADKTTGLSQKAFLGAATPIGAALQNVGFNSKQAADEAVNLTKRAADLASIFNTDLDSALTAIQSGLRGEADPLERFGVGLSDANVKAYALKTGISRAGKEMTDQQKVTARLGLLFEQTNKIQGDFVNTSDQLANKQRINAARFENLQAVIGEKLLPIKLKLSDIVSTLLDKFDWLTQNTDKVKNAFKAFGAALDFVFGSGYVDDWIEFSGQDEDQPITLFLLNLSNGFIAVKDAINQVITPIKTFFERYIVAFIPTLQLFLGILLVLATQVLAGLKGAWEQLKQPVGDLMVAFIDFWETVQPLLQGFLIAITIILVPAFQYLLAVVVQVFSGIITAVSGALNVVTGIIKTVFGIVAGIMTGDFSAAAQGFKQILNGLKEFLWGATKIMISPFRGFIDAVRNILQGIDFFGIAVNWINSLIAGVKSKAGGIGGAIKQGIGNMLPAGLKKLIPGHANGVRNFAGGLSIVGERGPELVNLPKGADVFSNEESRRMAGGQGITIETMNIKSGVDWEVGASYLAQKLRLS